MMYYVRIRVSWGEKISSQTVGVLLRRQNFLAIFSKCTGETKLNVCIPQKPQLECSYRHESDVLRDSEWQMEDEAG